MFSVGVKGNSGCNGMASFSAMPGSVGTHSLSCHYRPARILSSPGTAVPEHSGGILFDPPEHLSDPYAFLEDTPKRPIKLRANGASMKITLDHPQSITISNPPKHLSNGVGDNSTHVNKLIIKSANAPKTLNTPINQVKCVKSGDQQQNMTNTSAQSSDKGHKQLRVRPVSELQTATRAVKTDPITDVDYEYLIARNSIPSVHIPKTSIDGQVPARKLPSGKPHPSRMRPQSHQYSKSCYHEALQRIEPKQEALSPPRRGRGQHGDYTTTLGGTWHAPGAYMFDYEICTGASAVRKSASTEERIYAVRSQHTWFSSSLQQPGLLPRDLRLSLKRAVLRRQVYQVRSALRGVLQECPLQECKDAKDRVLRVAREAKEALQELVQKNKALGDKQSLRTLPLQRCCYVTTPVPPLSSSHTHHPTCHHHPLPGTSYCHRHITQCPDQQLFRACLAKFSDNTQCTVPVCDVGNDLALCREHAWKRDNYIKITAESKPKKSPRKRPKPSAMIRPQKRNKKKKRPPVKVSVKPTPPVIVEEHTVTENSVLETSSACESSEDTGIGGGLSETEFMPSQDHIVEQVLSFGPEIASRLLDETDFTNVLNQIPHDAFNDLFAEPDDQYEANMAETEELQRALEAVDEEVKSLAGKLGGNNLLLMDGLLDDHCIAETLAQLG